MENNDNIKDDFFVIESDNLESYKSNFYGYMISEDTIILNDNISDDTKLTGNGSYVHIKNDSDNITISQDFLGSYALYYYKNENYFAVSNSFINLMDLLKEKFLLTINEDYSKIFLSLPNISAFNETLINEINLVPKDFRVIIDKTHKTLEFQKINYEENTVELNTQQGIAILDKWFNKWVNIIRQLYKQANNITISISGNITSRIIISLILNSNINLNNLNIISTVSKNPQSNIMAMISECIDIEFDEITQKGNIKDIDLSIEKSFKTKLGSYNKMYYENNTSEIYYNINDDNTYFNNYTNLDSIDDLINNSSDYIKHYYKSYDDLTGKFFWDNIHKVQKHIKNYDIYSPYFLRLFLTHTFFRNKIGKFNVEKFLSNKINLNPLMDVELQKLTLSDKKYDFNIILFETIIQRFSNNLKEVPIIEEKFSLETTSYVADLNNKYPYEKQEYGYLSNNNSKNISENNYPNDDEVNIFVKKTFFSNSFKHNFLKYYPEQIYQNISRMSVEDKHYFMDYVYATIAVLRVLNSVEYSQNKSFDTELDVLKNYVTINNPNNSNQESLNTFLKIYTTARVDIINEASITNQVKVIDISDEKAQISRPGWFSSDIGEGMCISSEKGELNFKIKCVNDGLLKISLRTLDVRDRNSKRFPIYIDYLSFIVDNTEYLKDNKLTWHDKPISYSKKVLDNEIIEISIKWRPFTNLSNYEG